MSIKEPPTGSIMACRVSNWQPRGSCFYFVLQKTVVKIMD